MDNDIITKAMHNANNSIHTFWNASEFGADIEMQLVEYENDYLFYVFSLDPPISPPFPSGSTHIVDNGFGDRKIVVDPDEDPDGVCLGTFSFRLKTNKLDSTAFSLKTGGTSPATGIRVAIDGVDSYQDDSVFRFSLIQDSDNNNLADILIDGEGIEDFDPEVTEYEYEILEEKEDVIIKPIVEDETATIKVEVKIEDPDNTGQYIYEEIEITEEGDYEVPLAGLR